MKRSKALEMIEIKINEWYENLGTDNEIPLWSLSSDILLRLEEDIGMNPPPDPTTKGSDLGTLCQWEYEGENHE
jgi:hypothetical protein